MNIMDKDLIVRKNILLKISCSIFCCQLSRKVVQNIHLSGGSLLGVSRGGPKVSDIVDSIQVLD